MDTDANGVLDERIYYVHNWRNDVVALVTDTGEQVESVRYSAYGIPFGSPAGDAENDGDVNGSASTDDTDQIQTWISTATYDVRGDLDLDGDVDTADKTAALANAGTITGWKDLTSDDVGNDKGYAGYEFDDTIQAHTTTWHIRHRVLVSTLGRWMQRDALIEVAFDPYQYAYGAPIPKVDSDGRVALTIFGAGIIEGLVAVVVVIVLAVVIHLAPGLDIDVEWFPRTQVRAPSIPKVAKPQPDACDFLFEDCELRAYIRILDCCLPDFDTYQGCIAYHQGAWNFECATQCAICKSTGQILPSPDWAARPCLSGPFPPDPFD